MILFRGTWDPERAPKPINYNCVYFASTFDYAASYAAGENSGHDRKVGYVQRYRFPRQTLLDRDTKKASKLATEYVGKPVSDNVLLELFWDPPGDWISFLDQMGFTGTTTGIDVCIFRPEQAVLLDQWKVEWLEFAGKRNVYRRGKV